MADFVLLTTNWYRLNARDLPWRRTKNAYFIWLSEVILQQTRVDQGMNYYQKFIQNYPTIQDLANADEAEVLKLWQGLGYYSRARNLLKTAKQVVEIYDGFFPNDYNELLKLKGIGPYSAAAIASFAYDLPHAVLDGNVFRVLSRYYGIDTPIDSTAGKKEFQTLVDQLIPVNEPALFNQAIMEFGAMMCTPNNPNCELCPVAESCVSRPNEAYKLRPIKAKKTKVTKRYFHYFHLKYNDQVYLTKRTDSGIWQQLFEFPLVETMTEQLEQQDLVQLSTQLPLISPVFVTKHILSHQHIFAHFYQIRIAEPIENAHLSLINEKDLHDYPIHRLMEKYLESL